jgi:acylphosphatase
MHRYLGQVVGEAQGNEDALKKLKSDLKEGPRAAHVVKLEVKEIQSKEGESSFDA